MGKRTPFTQRVDEDLQAFVDRAATQTNLSKADVIDEALRRLRDAATITDDGQFVVDGEYASDSPDEAANGLDEVIENQQEMLALLRDGHAPSETNGADIFSDDRDGGEESSDRDDETVGGVPDTTRVTDVEEQIANVAGEYHHDECIDPDEVATLDISDSNVVKQKPDHLIPAVVGMINHDNGDWVDSSDVEDLVVGSLGMSRSTARNYREQMIRQGVLRPHPSIDEEIVGDEMLKSVKKKAASASQEWVHSYEDIDNPDRFADDVADYISEYVSGWDRDQVHLAEYCVDRDAYVDELWRLVAEAAEKMAGMSAGTNAQHGMSDSEQMRGASRVVVALVGRLDEVAEIDGRRLQEAVVEARQTGDADEYREWMVDWAEIKHEVRATLYDVDGSDEELGEDEAREILGVDADASDDEIVEAYREYVMSNHPDADGDGGEMDVSEYHDVLAAKRTLIG